LEDYLLKGYINEEEFQVKKNVIVGTSKPETPKQETSSPSNGDSLSDDQKNQLKKLEEYLSKGYINEEEFQTKKKTITGGNNSSSSSMSSSSKESKDDSSQIKEETLKKLSKINELKQKLDSRISSLTNEVNQGSKPSNESISKIDTLLKYLNENSK